MAMIDRTMAVSSALDVSEMPITKLLSILIRSSGQRARKFSEAKARKLQEHDPVVERWLVDVVGPTLDRHRANPSEARPIDEAMADLDAMMSADALPDLSE